MNRKKSLLCIIILTLILTISFAHSGRTDSSGGHRDNKNASGLGFYHYHCGGHPAHLHTNGYCPYTSYNSISIPSYTPSSPAPTTTSSTDTAKSSKISVNPPTYPVTINNSSIENYCFNWKPFVYEDITYLPMTSYVIQELGLTSSFDSINGFNVTNNTAKKAQFLDDYIVIIPTGSNIYHKFDCPYLDLTSFDACSQQIAQECLFEKCNYCYGF